MLYAMYIDYGGYNMDATTYTMILVAKLWGLGFCYKDGELDDSKLTKDQ